ncbi:MAG: DUF805 domain-containing protein [Moraxellaceae bacterium]
MEWYLKVVRDNYANFTGRARRQEYWMFSVFHLIAIIVLAMIDGVIFGNMILTGLYLLATLVPSLAVTIRRFHDQDKSGWFVLLSLIPVIGGLILLVFMCLEGTRAGNRFGADPKAMALDLNK